MVVQKYGIIVNGAFVENNSPTHCKQFSDGYMIKKVGTSELYDEAIDVLPCKYDYEETDVAKSEVTG